MNRVISCIMVAVMGCFFLLSAYSIPLGSKPSSPEVPSGPLKAYQQPPSFLFVMQATKAVLTPVKDKGSQSTHLITMKLADLSRVTAFSDRPYRIVTHLTVDHFKALWSPGDNSWGDVAPNAVLTASGMGAQIVELTDYQVKGDVVTIAFLSLGDDLVANESNQELSEVTITIDSLECTDDFCPQSFIPCDEDDFKLDYNKVRGRPTITVKWPFSM